MEAESEDTCVICMTNKPDRTTACGHEFCSACLTRYAEVLREASVPCPVCRRPLPSRDLPPEARSALATNINTPELGLGPPRHVVDHNTLIEMIRGYGPRRAV